MTMEINHSYSYIRKASKSGHFTFTVENMVFCRSVFHCFKDVLALQIHFKRYYWWSWDQWEACCKFQRYLKIFSAAPTPLYKACSLQQLHHVNIMPSQASQALKMAVLHLYGNLEKLLQLSTSKLVWRRGLRETGLLLPRRLGPGSAGCQHEGVLEDARQEHQPSHQSLWLSPEEGQGSPWGSGRCHQVLSTSTKTIGLF